MIIKVCDDALRDRFLVEAAYIRWVDGDDSVDKPYVLLEIYIVATQTKKVNTTCLQYTGIEEDPSLRLRIYNGDRVFIMNNEGKTIDSKRVVVGAENRKKERHREIEARGIDPESL